MRWLLSLTGCVVATVALGACGAEPSTGPAEGIRVEAQQAVLVTGEPLGDVKEGELEAGDAATALCFVAETRTNTVAAGAAIQIKSGGFSGYAAVTDFADDPADRGTELASSSVQKCTRAGDAAAEPALVCTSSALAAR